MPDLQNNFVTTDAAGDVGALFPGGLQILASTNVTPPTDRQIQWVRESDGAVVAEFKAWGEPGPSAARQMELLLETGDQGAGLFEAGVHDADTGDHATVGGFLFGEGVSSHSSVSADTSADDGGSGVAIIESDGSSNFIQGSPSTIIGPSSKEVRLQGPYSILVPAIAAGGFGTVNDSGGWDISGGTGPHILFGQAQVGAGNQRVVLMGQNFPSVTNVNLLFYNPTAAASIANIPFRYAILSLF